MNEPDQHNAVHDFLPDDPAWRRWPRRVWECRERLRHSPRALQLLQWLEDPYKVQLVLGRDGYREATVSMLELAQPGDCVAAGFDEVKGDPHCVHFNSDLLNIHFELSPEGRHRAVLWTEPDWPGAALWVDGRWVVDPKRPGCERAGRWVDERLFAVHVAGPEDHPRQGPDFGGLGTVLALLVIDGSTGRHCVLQHADHEHWPAPWLVREGNRWLLHPEREACERGDLPARTFTSVEDLLG